MATNPCAPPVTVNGSVCNSDGLCKLCSRPIFPSDNQPINIRPNNRNPNGVYQPWIIPLDGINPYPIIPQNPIFPLPNPQPNQPTQPIYLQPRQPVQPTQPIQVQPIQPTQPTQPIQQPIPNPPNPNQPIQLPILPSNSGGDGNQAAIWLLTGAGGPGALGAADIALLIGADVPLYAWLGPIALVVAAVSLITAGIFELVGTGRPKLQATDSIAKFANSPSPILSAIGQAALRGQELGIPLSTSNPAVWAAIFGSGVNSAYSQLQAQYPTLNTNVLMYILLSEMGDPANHSPIFITRILADELKSGKIKLPSTPTAPVAQTVGKLRVVRRGRPTLH